MIKVILLLDFTLLFSGKSCIMFSELMIKMIHNTDKNGYFYGEWGRIGEKL